MFPSPQVEPAPSFLCPQPDLDQAAEGFGLARRARPVDFEISTSLSGLRHTTKKRAEAG